MPTGYTASVKDGEVTELSDFMLHLARGFGALAHMREEPMDAEIPDTFEPRISYDEECIAEAERQLEELGGLSGQQIEERYRAAIAEGETKYRESCERVAADRGRYEAMIAKVEAWEPPTPDHEHMKDYALQQLRESITFDCSQPNKKWYVPTETTAEEWIDEQIHQASKDLRYHTEHLAEEKERAATRTAWVQALKRSLGLEVAV